MCQNFNMFIYILNQDKGSRNPFNSSTSIFSYLNLNHSETKIALQNHPINWPSNWITTFHESVDQNFLLCDQSIYLISTREDSSTGTWNPTAIAIVQTKFRMKSAKKVYFFKIRGELGQTLLIIDMYANWCSKLADERRRQTP